CRLLDKNEFQIVTRFISSVNIYHMIYHHRNLRLNNGQFNGWLLCRDIQKVRITERCHSTV
ncbi:hypothetical protein AB4170_23880, partial [Vibrio splendidus]